MKRRAFLKVSSALAACVAICTDAKQSKLRKTFILIHGTWHGGWEWKEVAQYLRDQGHVVYCPSLTGCGDRKHLASPDVGLETHITDITNLIEYEELNNIFLVGHSYSGVTITGVADRLKERIKRIVFFDALVPTTNPITAIPRNSEGKLPERWLQKKEHFIEGYMMDFWADYPLEMLVPKSAEAERERLKRLITLHPARAWEDEVILNNGGWQDLPRSFIHCVGQTFQMSSERMVGPARQPGWDFIELNIPRNGMMTHPKLVAETFLNMT